MSDPIRIKITEANRSKIQAAIDAIQLPRVKVRLIDADTVYSAVRRIQGKLIDILYTKDWEGLEVTVDAHAQKFASRYKGIPESTGFHIKRTKNAWLLTSVRRQRTSAKELTIYHMADKANRLAEFIEENF